MPLTPCPECDGRVSTIAVACPHCGYPKPGGGSSGGAARLRLPDDGFDYRSPVTVFGLPLLAIAKGVDPATGRKRVARGVLAVGDVAVGPVACGGVAVGGLCVGGVAVGLVAVGGLAVAAVLAVGGAAAGARPTGGVAVGPRGLGGTSSALRRSGPGTAEKSPARRRLAK